jgi:hypothetical protein
MANGRAAREFAINGLDADCQQAAPTGQRLHRTTIQSQCPGQLQMIGQPLLAGGQRGVAAYSSVPITSPRAAEQHVGSQRPLTISVCAPLRAARRAARTLVIMPPLLMPLPAPPAMASKRAVVGATFADQRGGRVPARVGGVEAVLVGQDDQRLGLDQIGHQCAERIVVAELDFVVDNRVVLVDDRHHAQFQQGAAAWSAHSGSGCGRPDLRVSAGSGHSLQTVARKSVS